MVSWSIVGSDSYHISPPVFFSPLLDPRYDKQDKLECTEELGDLISQVDANMALSVYLRANAAEKVVNSFSQRGEFDKMVAYASKVCVCVFVCACV